MISVENVDLDRLCYVTTSKEDSQFYRSIIKYIDEYLKLDESSVQISAPDENGMYAFTWKNGESYESLDRYNLQVGELFVMGYGFNDTGLVDAKRLDYVKTITLNGDGTVTLAVYMSK